LIKSDAYDIHAPPFRAALRYLFLIQYSLEHSVCMNRISILELLIEQPYNINQLSDIIKIDYKDIPHHIHMLEKNNLVTKEEKNI
jgi:DNA-binding MarR family transcriptional regulator